ncbi:Ribokinase-like, partial [Sesbania bispinosa]
MPTLFSAATDAETPQVLLLREVVSSGSVPSLPLGVDFSGTVDDEFLKNLGLEKGTRKVVNHEERGRVLQAMDGCSYKAAAGGSLSNSLVALARLGNRSVEAPAINVAMAGSVGSDLLGGFYREKLRRANVQFLSAPIKDGTTGTVIVLTTPDAQRTMLAYQGTSSTVNYDTSLASAVSKTNILVVEGYLFELSDTIKTITKACKEARSSGALVAITASDVSCIERHFDNF